MKAIRAVRIVVIAVTLAALLGGCPTPVNEALNSGADGPPGLMRFDSSQQLLDYCKQEAWNTFVTARQRQSESWSCYCGPEDAYAVAYAAVNHSLKAADASLTTTSSEPDPNPSDAVVSDGAYFYVAKGPSLRVVAATPVSDLAEAGRVDLDAEISRLYLRGSRVIALSSPWSGGNIVYEIDVSDPTHPTLVARDVFPGYIRFSRLIADRLVLVVQSTVLLSLSGLANPLDIFQVQLEEILPTMNCGTGDQPLVRSEHWYRPNSPYGLGVTAVITLSADDITNVVSSFGVLANTDTVYCSDNAVYCTIGRREAGAGSQCLTDVHALYFGNEGVAEHIGSAEVTGQLPTAAALDEFDGCLRIATTIQDPPPADSVLDGARQLLRHTAISALAQHNGTLEVVGRIDGLAPQQYPPSLQFVGAHALLTTSADVDPLFVMDFSDPTAPQLLGQTTVPGLDGYLHALDDTHVIAAGEYSVYVDHDLFRCAQLSLFDVSDWSHPRIVQQLRLGGQGSRCEASPSAFASLADRGLLTLPMVLSDPNETQFAWSKFEGAVVFRVDPTTGFTELGRLEAADGPAQTTISWGQRATVLGNAVYSITPKGVRGAPLGKLANWTVLRLE